MTRGLIIDNFAGGGGASTGIEAALRSVVDIAINHDPEAVAMHLANHPGTKHFCQSIMAVDPLVATGGAPVALAWFSPDCKHHSKAKGGKPVEKGIRDLAWIVVHWAERLLKATPDGIGAPAVIMLENVEEFRQWGPLTEDDRPDPAKRGETFDLWVRALKRLGYKVQYRELRACDYGAPTSRKRLFLIARRDGRPIVWPEPTHGKPGTPEVESGARLPWRTAAECIDWSIPCPSIFERSKDLKDNTHRRIAHGVMRYVVNAARPFIVDTAFVNTRAARTFDPADPLRTATAQPSHGIVDAAIVPITHSGDVRVDSPDDPLRTITTANRGELAAISATVAPVIVGCGGRRGQSGPVDPAGPYPTTTAKADACIAAATMVQMGYGEREGQAPRALDVEAPLGTVVAGGAKHGLVTAHLEKFSQNSRGKAATDPLDTAIASAPRHAVIETELVQAASLDRQFGTSRGASVQDSVGAACAGSAKTAVVSSFLHKYRPNSPGASMDEPAPTITANSYIKRPGGAPPISVVCAHMEQANTGLVGHDMLEPVSTIVGRGSTQRLVETTLIEEGALPPAIMERAVQVAAFLIKYYGNETGGHGLDEPIGTVTTKERFAVVTVTIETVTYVIVDIGMRMLSPRELARAQGFPDSYILDPIGPNGKPLSKTAQIRMIGNSVCPDMAKALAGANIDLEVRDQVAA